MEKLTLIDGKFSATEASDILKEIFTIELNFHKIKNFTSQERDGKEDETSMNRIIELIQNINQIKSITANAKQNNKSLIIKSEVYITY